MSVDHSNPVTLSRFILADKDLQSNNDLCILFSSISLACKVIAMSVRKAGLTGMYGLDGTVNATGDDVKKLDVLSNDIFVNALKFSTKIEVMVSEENAEPIIVKNVKNANYCIAFDPLDGSSNIDCNISTGTIFAIYKKKESDCSGSVQDILLPGNKLCAAGYCMYGSSTQLVWTCGKGVHGFTLDPTIGEFILHHKNIQIPSQPKRIYSANEGNYMNWDEPTKKFVEECKLGEKPYSARYVGSMVSDVHRTLLYGGVFMYPADKVNKSGKLRLLYEANPMSFIVEQAGGKSTTGTTRILDIVPTKIHEKTPIFLGCKRDVERIEILYRETGNHHE